MISPSHQLIGGVASSVIACVGSLLNIFTIFVLCSDKKLRRFKWLQKGGRGCFLFKKHPWVLFGIHRIAFSDVCIQYSNPHHATKGVTLILQELDNSADNLHDHLQLDIHRRGPPSQCHCHYVSSVSSFQNFPHPFYYHSQDQTEFLIFKFQVYTREAVLLCLLCLSFLLDTCHDWLLFWIFLELDVKTNASLILSVILVAEFWRIVSVTLVLVKCV